jgi:hypothetical protein
MASYLSSLTLTTGQRVIQPNVVEQRRQKLKVQLAEQRRLAEAEANGESYVPTKSKKIIDAESGEEKAVDVPKRLKAWWWKNAAGKTLLAVKYGARSLELAKGKNSIEVANGQLVQVLATLEQAIDAGELDAALAQVSQSKRRTTT